MLVLTRKCSEMIQIGEDIVIKIIKTGRTTVKIGIEAPKNVRVVRGEIAPHMHVTVEGPHCPESVHLSTGDSDHQRQPACTDGMLRVGSALVPDGPVSQLVC